MSGPAAFRLSPETYELLKKHRDFYKSVIQLQEDGQSPLVPKATDAESHTEFKTLDNDEREITIVLPVDDDSLPENGRIYLRDRFVFDPLERRLISFQRSFEHNGTGGPEWKEWLARYRATTDATLDENSPQTLTFAKNVALSSGRPLTDENANTLPNIKAALSREIDLLATVQQQISDLNQGFTLKVKDRLNYFNIVRRNSELEITLQIAIDDDASAANGRILMRDKFKLDANTLAYLGLERTWSLSPEATTNPRFQIALESLKSRPKPDAKEAERFVRSLLPEILPEGVPESPSPLSQLSRSLNIPAGYRSPIGRRGMASKSERKHATQLALEAMHAVAVEQAYQNQEQDQNLEEKLRELHLFFQGLTETASNHPELSPFELMTQFPLTNGPLRLRQGLLADATMQEIDALSSETDPQLRVTSYLNIVKRGSSGQAELNPTAALLAPLQQLEPQSQAEIDTLMARARGNVEFGKKLELVLSRFVHEVTKPSMLLGMAAAPLLGGIFELGALKLVRPFLATEKLAPLFKIQAAYLGILGESLGFSIIHRGLENPRGNHAWNGLKEEILSSQLLFGAMRLAHYGAGWATSQMAEGAWGSRLGALAHAAETPAQMLTMPNGRVLLNEGVFSSPIGIPTLTREGEALSGAMNHLGGIFAMQASTALSRKGRLMPAQDQGFGMDLFDAAILYTQALVGARLAHSTSGGLIHRQLAKLNVGIENLQRGIVIPSTPLPMGVKGPDRPLPHHPLRMDQINNIPHRELEKIWELPMRDLPREILASPIYRPIHKVRSGEQDFYLSRVFETFREVEGVIEKRRYVLALVPVKVDGNTVLKRRFFYASGSDAGAWRASPYMVGDNHIAKGVGRHYTQETQPTWEISEALLRLEQHGPAPYEIPHLDFTHYISSSSKALDSNAQRTMLVGFQGEVFFPKPAGITSIQKLQPGKAFALPEGWGWGSKSDIQSTLSQMINMRWPDGFIPDFTRAPHRMLHQPNSLLGPLSFREYRGAYLVDETTGRKRPITWVLGEDMQGRAWVRHLHFADSAVNSYGVYSEVLDSGILTSKPLEYSAQAGLLPEIYRRPFNSQYTDISPTLTLLEPIRRYRAARGLSPLLLQPIDLPTLIATFGGQNPGHTETLPR